MHDQLARLAAGVALGVGCSRGSTGRGPDLSGQDDYFHCSQHGRRKLRPDRAQHRCQAAERAGPHGDHREQARSIGDDRVRAAGARRSGRIHDRDLLQCAGDQRDAFAQSPLRCEARFHAGGEARGAAVRRHGAGHLAGGVARRSWSRSPRHSRASSATRMSGSALRITSPWNGSSAQPGSTSFPYRTRALRRP